MPCTLLASAARLASVTLAMVCAIAVSPVDGQSVERQMIVSVLDEDGAPVAGLTPTDFVVREDGDAREVLRVSQDAGSRQIALMVDTSQNARPIVGDLRRGASAFVARMAEGNQIAVVSFGGAPRILTAPTSRVDALQEGVDGIFAYPETGAYLLDAVSETVQGFERREAARPLIVVLTTLGIDYSQRDARPLVDRLEEAGVSFYSVVFADRRPNRAQSSIPDAELERRLLERDMLLDLGPTRTGGRRRDLQSSAAAASVLEEIADDLRGQDLIAYARPDSLIPPEDIEVEVTRDGLDATGTPLLVGE